MYKYQDFFKDKQGRSFCASAQFTTHRLGYIYDIEFTLGQSTDKIHALFVMLSFGFIFTWAWLEITSGVNYFRRALGLSVLIIAVWFDL